MCLPQRPVGFSLLGRVEQLQVPGQTPSVGSFREPSDCHVRACSLCDTQAGRRPPLAAHCLLLPFHWCVVPASHEPSETILLCVWLLCDMSCVPVIPAQNGKGKGDASSLGNGVFSVEENKGGQVAVPRE